jgi:hypothetical protein
MAASFESRADDEQPRAGREAERSTPYKLSVSVEAATYVRLRKWLAAASGLAGANVPASKVGAALFAELMSDDELSRRVLIRVMEQVRR